MSDVIYDPEEIRRRSFAYIRRHLETPGLSDPQRRIARAVVHTGGDLSLASNLRFHRRPLRATRRALDEGVDVVTDVSMVKAGLRKPLLERNGVRAHSYVHHQEVHRRAPEAGLTRSAAALDFAAERHDRFCLVVGNAPTTLMRLMDRKRELSDRVPVVVGMPVGFVSVEASKRRLLSGPFPAIVLEGTRGGSPLAAAVANALLGEGDPREERE